MKKDETIEMKHRRNKGEFYTPTLFVDYAHKMISEALGEDWRDEYIVWDNCCGTKNLTRDYRFKELYCSTLEDAELEIGKKYNPEACAFQFDFLNDDLEKLPKGLLEAFEQNKKIVFFLNPPYGKNGTRNSVHHIKSRIADIMCDKNLGQSSSVLYGEFLYRIIMIKEKYNLTNCHIAIFCKPTFFSLESFEKFRSVFFDNFKFKDGILFQASNFGDVSGAWGVSFNIWETGLSYERNTFVHKLIESDGGEIKVIGEKNLYNTDNIKSPKEWCIIKIKNPKSINTICQLSPSKINNKFIKTYENVIGYSAMKGNCVFGNAFVLTLQNVPYGECNIEIYKENFDKVISLFAARILSPQNWMTDKDSYLIPDEQNTKFQEFVNDSIVYSLFNSYTISKKLIIENTNFQIINNFFWMSKSEIESLANEYNNDECYNDAHTSPERFVYKKLQEIELSTEAQAVLDKACDIVRNTFKYRELFNDIMPEAQINNWDCGFYQIKLLCKEFAPDLLKEFKDVYKQLADKMRPMVYELGFLK